MKRRCIALLLCAAAVSAAAQGSGYAERFARVCAACHGASGVSTQALTPTLAGQPSFYAITQLFLFRDGRRDNAVMSAVAQGMSDDDLRGFSEAIAALPAPPPPAAPADLQRFERGAALAPRRHCPACHGADRAGGKQVPRLAGQREDYLLHALRGFRAATRVGYSAAMTEALAGTTAAQLEDLAYHLAHAGAATSRH